MSDTVLGWMAMVRVMALLKAAGHLYCFFYLLVAVHELAHAVAAAVLGVRIFEISIGRGPIVYALDFGDMVLRLSLIPVGGHVDVSQSRLLSLRGWQVILFFEAGPLAACAAAMIIDLACSNLVTSVTLLLGLASLITSNIPFIKGTDAQNMVMTFSNLKRDDDS